MANGPTDHREGQITISTRARQAIALVLLATAHPGAAQPAAAPSGVITIPYLVNATKPADIDFAAAQCDVDRDGGRMTCRFRQVFITRASFDPTACVITTNSYERTFRRAGARLWTSEDPAAGDCAIVETTTLDDGGGTRWTMTIDASTQRPERAECRAQAADSEVYEWKNVKRPLPCATVQPGAIER